MVLKIESFEKLAVLPNFLETMGHNAATKGNIVLSGTSVAGSLLPWRLPSIIFSGEFGGSQETATLKFCIKFAHLDSVFNRFIGPFFKK